MSVIFKLILELKYYKSITVLRYGKLTGSNPFTAIFAKLKYSRFDVTEPIKVDFCENPEFDGFDALRNEETENSKYIFCNFQFYVTFVRTK